MFSSLPSSTRSIAAVGRKTNGKYAIVATSAAPEKPARSGRTEIQA